VDLLFCEIYADTIEVCSHDLEPLNFSAPQVNHDRTEIGRLSICSPPNRRGWLPGSKTFTESDASGPCYNTHKFCLLESWGHSSLQSGTPSPSESVSTSQEPHLPAKVFAGSWGHLSLQSGTSSLSEPVCIDFSATPQTRNLLVNIVWAFI
jgi:hypothetical protein